MTFTIKRINRLLVILVGLISSAGVWAQAGVATLEHIHGVVMIDHGDGYAISHAGDAIHPGDRVLLMEESAGSILSGHCVLQLEDNSLHIIGPQGACEAGHLAARQVGSLYAAAIGVIKPKTEVEPEPQEIEKPPEASPSGAKTPDKVVKQTPDEKPKPVATAARISPKAIAIGAGIAAALAALGGGGGGGNASTPDH